jgi:hypothetical protein
MKTCERCGEQRWPFHPKPGLYTCQRCQEVLRGSKHVIDPLKVRSEAQQESSRRNLVRGNRPQERSGGVR